MLPTNEARILRDSMRVVIDPTLFPGPEGVLPRRGGTRPLHRHVVAGLIRSDMPPYRVDQVQCAPRATLEPGRARPGWAGGRADSSRVGLIPSAGDAPSGGAHPPQALAITGTEAGG